MPVVYDKMLDVYSKAGVAPKIVPTPGAGPHNHAGLMLVASGKGTYVCIGIPQTGPQPAGGVKVVPISDALAIEVYLPTYVQSRKNPWSQANQYVVGLLQHFSNYAVAW